MLTFWYELVYDSSIPYYIDVLLINNNDESFQKTREGSLVLLNFFYTPGLMGWHQKYKSYHSNQNGNIEGLSIYLTPANCMLKYMPNDESYNVEELK